VKTVKCKYCGREILFDSTLCSYCGKVINKFQNLIDVQKKKQIDMAKMNETKMELIRNAFKPIKLQMSRIKQSGQLNENVRDSYKSKLVKYFLVFSMFITLLIVIVFVFGSIA